MAVYILDYGAGNVRSVVNAVRKAGVEVKFLTSPSELDSAQKLIFPGVGAFGPCMERLHALGFTEPLKAYIRSGRPYFGICLGLQTLFEGSDEAPGTPGLGIIPGQVTRFSAGTLAVPHIGWNQLTHWKQSDLILPAEADDRVYFVHSFKAMPTEANSSWVLSTTDYGERFISSVLKGNVLASQFHPEKSGALGLELFRRFLLSDSLNATGAGFDASRPGRTTSLARRVIACLDVRSNDAGDVVVTKGDQYDVREEGNGAIRNLGKPVTLAEQYYMDGADEITFLNITSFRSSPLQDQPMLEILRQTSETVFVPLCIGGGIQDTVDPDGTPHSALEVAAAYFRSGADKVSIGSDAVRVAEEFLKSGVKTGKSSIEEISRVYGSQACVVSIDPKRVYVASPDAVRHHTIPTSIPGPNGEAHCWYQCTVKGGREARDLGAYELAKAAEALGAGELMLNCIDHDGTNKGYDLELITMIKNAVRIPVIASSGAGCEKHFEDVFNIANADAALAAGIFHRREVPLQQVKQYLKQSSGLPVR